VNSRNKTEEEKRMSNRLGFTLSEVMIAVSVFGLVMASTIPAFMVCQRDWKWCSNQLTATQKASAALERLVYGVGDQYGFRSATAASVVVTPGVNWSVSYTDIVGNASSFAYIQTNKQITFTGIHAVAGPNGTATNGTAVIGKNITAASVSNSALGMRITLTAAVSDSRYSATTTMTTYVSYRN
jgi:prepilin-type N-terminal cleavage/methylation domain-containing protein